MNNEQAKAILTVALMAAFADGLKDERERESIRKLAEVFGAEANIDLAALYRDVLLARPNLAEVVRPLDAQGLRQYAYEMTVGVVNADGSQNPAEAEFLAQLAAALQLPGTATEPVAQQASAMADAAVAPTVPATSPGVATAASAPTAVAGTVLGKANVSDAEMDKSILNASITNAALELLPESIASMAIIPLQLRLVYRIGKAYGYEMDSSNAKDFIATLGVGLTSQYVEQLGRKLLGGLLGGLGGGLGRSLGTAGGQFGPDLRHDVRDRSRGAALLRGRPHARCGGAEGDVHVPAGRGARHGPASTSHRSSRPRRRSIRASSWRW